MAIKQVSIFLSDEPGTLADLTGVLADNDINIHALSVADARDFGIIRLITENVTQTVAVLEEAGYVCSITDVLAVGVRSEVGSMHKLLEKISDAGVNIDYSYAFTTHAGSGAYMVARVEDVMHAEKELIARGVEVLDDGSLKQL